MNTKKSGASKVNVTLPWQELAGNPYATRRVNLRLAPAEALALRRIFDGMYASGQTLLEHGRAVPVDNVERVIKCVLQNLAQQKGLKMPVVEEKTKTTDIPQP